MYVRSIYLAGYKYSVGNTGGINQIIRINRTVDVDTFSGLIEYMAGILKKGGTIHKYKALPEGVKNMHDSVQKGEQSATTDFWKLISKSLIGQNFDALRAKRLVGTRRTLMRSSSVSSLKRLDILHYSLTFFPEINRH